MIASASLAPMRSYIDQVMDGTIVTCRAVRAAVERHCDDLERAESDRAFPYHFDETIASIAVDYFGLCLRHSIGRYAGLPFILEPWQVFGVACIFGWLRDDDNSRRFRHVYWSMARKNGKSCLGAGIAHYCASMDINPVTMQPESVAEVILSATKREQVEKVMYAEIERMRLQSPTIRERSTDINKMIKYAHNEGTIRCVGSDRPYDGLNPSLVVKDELHEWKETVHRKFYDTMQTGSGSRVQPLNITLTTAGDDKSYIWLEEYRHARAVALGEYDDEALFAFIFELDGDDDPLDKAKWLKANPNYGVSIRPEYLKEEANRANTSRIAKNRFTRYHGNRLVTSTEQAFDIDQWDKCVGELSDWKQADAIGLGVDLGGRDDFAAWASVARFIAGEKVKDNEDDPDEVPYVFRYELVARVYIAQDTERDLTRAPFAQWIHEGRIKVCKYPITEMKADILEFCDENEIEDVAFDPHNGQQFAEDLEQEGLVSARMPQTYAMFNEPISDFHQAITDGRLTHTGCPVLRWCTGNAVACRDRQDRWMLDKSNSIDKIDPVVASVMGYRRAMVAAGKATDDNLIITAGE